MIDEKIEIIKRSIDNTNDEIIIQNLKKTLKMLLDKKNGLIIPIKPRYSIYNKKEKKYRVYLIKLNDIVVYVGITKQTLNKRLATGGYVWLNIDENFVMELIEETDDFTREEHWIKEYKDKGYILYNKHIPTKIDRGIIKRLGRKEYHRQYGIEYRKIKI